MNRKGLRFVLVFATVLCVIGLPSCARDQELVSINIQPNGAIFGAANIPVVDNTGSSRQLRALGNYIHPPVTKDITDQVTWSSDTPDLVLVNSTGLITATGNACGGSTISATVNTNNDAVGRTSSGAIVTASVTATVVCFTGTGSGPLLAVNAIPTGTATGTVTSTPSGIMCPSTCTASFASGTPISLTAALTGSSTSVTWSGCIPNGLTCTISSLTADTVVTATFN
jgi:hypothetical protein